MRIWYGYALRQNEPALLAQMNQALAKLKADGTYNTLVARWFGPAEPQA